MTAAYRIEVQRNLQDTGWPWEAIVYPTEGTLADFPAHVSLGEFRDTALEKALQWIRDQQSAGPTHETLYVDERGEQVQP